MDDKNIIIKVRGVVTLNNKLLIVKHVGTDFMALPGGHLKYGEDIITCLKRELVEEFGILPEVGRLLYINTYIDKYEYVEFFFDVKNGKDYLNIEGLERNHAHELTEMLWISPDSDIKILPVKFDEDFKNNKILEGETKFISEL